MNAQTLVLLIVLVLIGAAIYGLESSKVSVPDVEEPVAVQGNENLSTQDQQRIAQKEQQFSRAPELAGISGYINTPNGTRLADFEDKIILVDFWTYSCINCIRTLPHLTEWDQKYRDAGLVIVGVHSPEFEFEKDYANVLAAVDKFTIEYPVVQDNDKLTWRAYQNRYWPRKYLVDADGFIRYDHIGEGAYEETEEVIRALLEENGADLSAKEMSSVTDDTPRRQTTPELYAGYQFALPRGQTIGNDDGLLPEQVHEYSVPVLVKPDVIHLDGTWESRPEDLIARAQGAAIFLGYTGSSVNIVARSEQPQVIEIRVDTLPLTPDMAGGDVYFEDGRSLVMVDEDRLYNLIDGEYGEGLLEIHVSDGFSFHAFTFG